MSWDEALDFVAQKMVGHEAEVRPDGDPRPGLCPAPLYGVLHKSDQIEGLLARFLGMFGCRTNSWSVPSYQGTTFSSRMTFGTITDGNEDDAFAHSKLIIMWGWNPAYTFHGGNTFYYMRHGQSSAAASSSWSTRNTPTAPPATTPGGFPSAQHRRGDAGRHGPSSSPTTCGTRFIDRFCQGMDAGTMPASSPTGEFQDYILGTRDNTPKTPVGRGDLRRCRPPTSGSWPDVRHQAGGAEGELGAGRNAAYGEQYNRMAAACRR